MNAPVDAHAADFTRVPSVRIALADGSRWCLPAAVIARVLPASDEHPRGLLSRAGTWMRVVDALPDSAGGTIAGDRDALAPERLDHAILVLLHTHPPQAVRARLVGTEQTRR